MTNKRTYFTPQLNIKSGIKDISFYAKACEAVELRRWLNDDGGIHVAELSIEGAIFHFHEEPLKSGSFEPKRHNGTTATIGTWTLS